MQLTERLVHIRVEGRSVELPLATLDLRDDATDSQLRVAVCRQLDLPSAALAGHVIVRTNQAIIIRPEAIYG